MLTLVTSLAEVWIEIGTVCRVEEDDRVSLPLRKCGLKSVEHQKQFFEMLVTSLAEVWIEIHWDVPPLALTPVTSLAEVWIEIEKEV